MATGSYDANGIWQYGEDDNIALFSDTLNKLADSTSDAFTSDRSRISTLEAGSLSGLIPVKPTTVTVASGTAAVNTIGTISFTGASNIDIDGVITSNYSNYRMIIDATYSINANLYWWPRKSGVADRPVNFSTQFLRVAGTGTSAGQSTGIDYGLLAQNTSGTRNVCAVDLIGFNSSTSQRNSFSNSIGSAYNISIITTIMTATATTTGLTLNLSGGTFTGTVTVYGYND